MIQNPCGWKSSGIKVDTTSLIRIQPAVDENLEAASNGPLFRQKPEKSKLMVSSSKVARDRNIRAALESKNILG